MSKRIFSKKDMDALLKNPNVEKCSKRLIFYRKEFKVLAVEKYYQRTNSIWNIQTSRI